MDQMIGAQDTLSEAKGLADALYMATADLHGPEERNALSTLARHVVEHIKVAMDLLNSHRRAAEAANTNGPLLALEPDVCDAHNAAQLLQAAVDRIKDPADRNFIAYSAGQVADASAKVHQRLYGMLGSDGKSIESDAA